MEVVACTLNDARGFCQTYGYPVSLTPHNRAYRRSPKEVQNEDELIKKFEAVRVASKTYQVVVKKIEEKVGTASSSF